MWVSLAVLLGVFGTAFGFWALYLAAKAGHIILDLRERVGDQEYELACWRTLLRHTFNEEGMEKLKKLAEIARLTEIAQETLSHSMPH